MSADEIAPKPTLGGRANTTTTTTGDRISPGARVAFGQISTATVVSQLQRRGIRSTFLSGLRALNHEQRMFGYAHTLRYIPMREDLQPTLGGLDSAQRRAVEGLQKDEILMIEARGEADVGTIGDIFAMRAFSLGAGGIVTDGALRDTPAIRKLGIPVYHRSSHAATLGRLHLPLEHQTIISCAGVTVVPGDVVMGDDEGAVVVPIGIAEEVARDSLIQEKEETWAFERVSAGESSIGVFPISGGRRSEYEQWSQRNGRS